MPYLGNKTDPMKKTTETGNTLAKFCLVGLLQATCKMRCKPNGSKALSKCKASKKYYKCTKKRLELGPIVFT